MDLQAFFDINKLKPVYHCKTFYHNGNFDAKFEDQHIILQAHIKRDHEIVLARLEAWKTRAEEARPRVGDYIIDKTGKKSRFTHAWDEGIQNGGGPGSFYMGKEGWVSYSGGLDPSIPWENIKYLGDPDEPGLFWLFSRDWPQAHSGIDFYAPCRIYCEVNPAPIETTY